MSLEAIQHDEEQSKHLNGGNWFRSFCCKGIRHDIRRRLPHYWSDWTDVLSSKIIASTLFIFFTSIAPAITFSLFISESTHDELGVIEILLSTALCGFLFSVIAGQPLIIVGVTGPVAILTASIYTLSKAWGLAFIPFYAWSQLWAAAMHLVLASANSCSMVKYVTRFSCETFGALIALLYIFTGLDGIAEFFSQSGGLAPALLQFIIALGTAGTAQYLSGAKHWYVGTETLRSLLSDYGPTLAVVLWSAVPFLAAHRLDEPLPTLFVPKSFTTTSGRGWLADLSDIPGWGVLAAIFPGAIITVLFYFDHNVSSLISQTADRQLKKGTAFHWDFFVLGLSLIITGLLGLPPSNGLIPQAPLHVSSLIVRTRSQPGQAFRVERVYEQRVTNALQSLLTILAAVFPFSEALRVIPTAVLYGLFLFLGASSFDGNQFAQRMDLIARDSSHRRVGFTDQPLSFTDEALPFGVVRQFTLLQAACCAAIFGITFTPAGVVFPVLIALLIVVRQSWFPQLFSSQELLLLDSSAFQAPEDIDENSDEDACADEGNVMMEEMEFGRIELYTEMPSSSSSERLAAEAQ